MDWQPIELTQERIDAFADAAVAFAGTLDADGRRLWCELIRMAGGDGCDVEDAHAAVDRAHMREMLHGIWQAGTTIAPLYSGAMPEGGGTVD
jgi:hypothetical protein